MPADLSPAEAAEFLAVAQAMRDSIETLPERILSAQRELVQVLAAPQAVQERASDFVTVQTFQWRSGDTVFRPQQIGASLDRLRVTFVTGGAPVPIIVAAQPFSLDDLGNDLQSFAGSYAFLPTPTVAFVPVTNEPIFTSGFITFPTRAALYFAPPPGDYLTSENVALSVVQEFTSPQAGPLPGGHPAGPGHPGHLHHHGCGCGQS